MDILRPDLGKLVWLVVGYFVVPKIIKMVRP